jgi:serine/threonine-protein kinase
MGDGWSRLDALFHEAAALTASERERFLDSVDEAALRAQLKALLAHADTAYLDGPAVAISDLEAIAGDGGPTEANEDAPQFLPGTMFGRYEVIAELGAGGMGRVYRARDSRLGRDVALKFPNLELTSDAEARERLRREALAASALNHPHVCTLYDVVDDDRGRPVLVMELVSGRSLDTAIQKEGLPLETVVRFGRQLVEALAHAHAHGIIHRDIKPANIIVTLDGRIKVLDFGIARHLRDGDLAAVKEPTALTGVGLIAGTLPYLAPEVLAGQPADARSDIWALGVVLYEIAAGTRPFDGVTGFAVSASILHEPMAPLPAHVPFAFGRILQRCLRKEPGQRYQSAGELGAALEMITPSVTVGTATSGAAPSNRFSFVRRRVITWAAVGALTTVLAGAVWTVMRIQPPRIKPVTRVTVTLGPDESLVDEGVAIATDDRRIAYIARRDGRQRVYVRSLDQFASTALAGTEDASSPFFSPDGRWVGYFARGKLWKVSIDGGTPAALSEAPHGRGGDWGPDDSVIFAPDGNTGLFEVSASGGPARPITTLDKAAGEVSHRAPQILPSGKDVLYTVFTGPSNTPSTRAVSLITGKTGLVQPNTWARYLADDRLLYVSNGLAVTAPFDPGRLVTTGPSDPLEEDMRRTPAPTSNVWPFAVSGTGALVFVPGIQATQQQRTLVWVDRHGVATPLGSPARAYGDVRLSPDGQKLALTTREASGTDIWIYELASDRFTRLTSDGASESPVWSPDGARLAFAADQLQEIVVRAADGTGPIERSLRATRPDQIPNQWRPTSWSPDGRLLSVMQFGINTMADIWSLSLESPAMSRPVVVRSDYQVGGRISPDGRWLAYLSNETGQWEVNVTSFPDGVGRQQVSSRGGTQVEWAQSGRELFYRGDGAFMVVPVETHDRFAAGKPVPLFDDRYLPATMGRPTCDVSPDGQRFVMVRTHGEDVATNTLNVVLGWTDALRREQNARQTK